MGHISKTRLVPVERLQSHLSVKQIANIAVQEWHDDPDDDRGDAGVWEVHLSGPASADTAWHLAEEFYETHSHEVAVVTPVPRDSDVKVVTRNVQVKVSGEVAERLRSSRSYEEHALLRKLVAEQTGERVTSLRVEKFPARRKAKVTATVGKTVTVYDVWGFEPGWKTESLVAGGMDSFPAAKARAAELAGLPENDRYSQFFVRGRVQRVQEDGTVERNMAVVVRPVADEVTVTVKATFESVKAGWKAKAYAVTFDVHI